MGGFQEGDRGRDDRLSGHSGNTKLIENDKNLSAGINRQYQHCSNWIIIMEL